VELSRLEYLLTSQPASGRSTTGQSGRVWALARVRAKACAGDHASRSRRSREIRFDASTRQTEKNGYDDALVGAAHTQRARIINNPADSMHP